MDASAPVLGRDAEPQSSVDAGVADTQPGSSPVDAAVADTQPGEPQLDAGVSATEPGSSTLDAGTEAPGQPQLVNQSRGCEQLPNTELCIGEGWMLATGEATPACGESAAYRVCTFKDGACVSHTVMMIQRCD